MKPAYPFRSVIRINKGLVPPGLQGWVQGGVLGLLLMASASPAPAQGDVHLHLQVTNRQAQLLVCGPEATTQELQYAERLATSNGWVPLTNLVLDAGHAAFLDTSSPRSVHRFYRAQSVVGAATAATLDQAVSAGLAQAQAEVLAQVSREQNFNRYDLVASASVPDRRAPALAWANDQWENRFFLDWNHSGGFEPNACAANGWQAGDPQWIGMPRYPEQPAGPTNPFVARYAFRVEDPALANEDRLNLNDVPGSAAWPGGTQAWWDPVASDETNALRAVQFFTNVAQRLLLEQYDEFNPDPHHLAVPSITTIPVWSPTPGFVSAYSSALHRLLQVAANLYDATRSDRYPSVFRPIIRGIGPTNYIVGFTNDNCLSTMAPYLSTDNTNGVPVVVGAKKGFPNFNECTLSTDFTLARKLELVFRGSNAPTLFQTNQMYLLGISNLFAFEIWNSYTQAYPNHLLLQMWNQTTVTLRNLASSTGGYCLSNQFKMAVLPTFIPAGAWPGTGPSNHYNFLVPASNRWVLLSNSVWRESNQTFAATGPDTFERPAAGQGAGSFPLPHWEFVFSNFFTSFLSEGDRLVDCVVLSGLQSGSDLTEDMMGPLDQELNFDQYAGCWDVTRWDGSTNQAIPTRGLGRQLDISLTGDSVGNTSDAAAWVHWSPTPAGGQNKDLAARQFRDFVALRRTNLLAGDSMQAPFTPMRKMVRTTTWQANDPLVHYHLDDLALWPTNSENLFLVPPNAPQSTNTSSFATLGRLNANYSPWGGNPKWATSLSDPLSFDWAIKDPGLWSSDAWDFPAGRGAELGWLGRVHRGTPWQTIYLKPENPTMDRWFYQSQDPRTLPAHDWRLADLFTVATCDPSTRGLFSCNPANLAAWSATLAGTVVLSNALSDYELPDLLGFSPLVYAAVTIQPVGSYPGLDPAVNPVAFLYQGVQNVRTSLSDQQFTQLSQWLTVPELSVASPFLNTTDVQKMFALNDAAYECLPRRLLSILKVGEPRLVIYAYGQVLKPAAFEPGTGLATNYHVMAESATRTVLRLEGTPEHPEVVIESQQPWWP